MCLGSRTNEVFKFNLVPLCVRPIITRRDKTKYFTVRGCILKLYCRMNSTYFMRKTLQKLCNVVVLFFKSGKQPCPPKKILGQGNNWVNSLYPRYELSCTMHTCAADQVRTGILLSLPQVRVILYHAYLRCGPGTNEFSHTPTLSSEFQFLLRFIPIKFGSLNGSFSHLRWVCQFQTSFGWRNVAFFSTCNGFFFLHT